MAPIMVQEIFALVKQINSEEVTVLLVEENVRRTLSICNRAYVVENGCIVLEGAGSELLNDEHVKEAYLGI